MPRTLHIRAHWAEGCGPAARGITRPASLDVIALGDFAPSNASVFQTDSSSQARDVAVPEATRAVVVKARAATTSTWSGVGVADARGDIDTLLLPDLAPCPIGSADGALYPGSAGGQAFAYSPAHRAIVVAGGRAGGDTFKTSELSGALVWDASTGAIRPASDGMARLRSGATATPHGPGFLIAGGDDPAASGQPHDTAEVLDLETLEFTESIAMDPRTRHAAVALVDGSTLLVGGTDGERALRTLQTITVGAERAVFGRLETLAMARMDPTALLLDTGNVLIAGGVDEAGAPVAELEWFDPTATRRLATTRLTPAAVGRHFVPLPGGGVLAAGGCIPGAGGECAPADDVFWIAPDRTVARSADDAARIAPLPAPVLEGGGFGLVAGTDGAPVLVAREPRDATLPRRTSVWRFDPWRARFGLAAEFEDPGLLPNHVVALDLGAIAWLSDAGRAELSVLRHDTRTAFAPDVGYLPDEDHNHGTHTAPLLPPSVEPLDPRTADAGVHLASLDSISMRGDAAGFTITDSTYRDFYLEVHHRGLPPRVRLGDVVLTEHGCADDVSAATTDAGAPGPLVVRRTGSRVTMTTATASTECDVELPDRVSVALLGREGPRVTFVGRVLISRDPTRQSP